MMSENEEQKKEMSDDRQEVRKGIAMSGKKLTMVIVISLIVGLIAGFAGMYFVGTGTGGMALVSKTELAKLHYMNQKYAKAEMLRKELMSKYYKDLDEDDIMVGMYKGMYAAVGDPYTMYLTAEEYEKLLAVTTGDFYGVGLSMSVKDDNIVVMSTIEGSPAAQAGFKAGDLILKVDGVSYTANTLDQAAAKMRGDLNTEVTITYSRNDTEKSVTLVRKKIVTDSVYSDILDGNIGYIRITSFEIATADDFKAELAKMQKAKVKGLVIDLRNNGGGIVDSGLAVADALLPEATIVYLEDKAGEREYHNSDAKATSLPYVLLVDGGSASTTEILAAAVQDNKGGTIVGTTTFGKGIVQLIEPLGDGSAVRVTMKQYFSPSGKTIQGKGVTPDYQVQISEGDTTDKQLEKALSLLQTQ